jgi:hypothetical protein
MLVVVNDMVLAEGRRARSGDRFRSRQDDRRGSMDLRIASRPAVRPRGRGWRLIAVALGVAWLAAWAAPGAAAREINLGGERSNGQTAPKLPPNVVELPNIVVAIRKPDGGWRHVKIHAWLAPKDVDVAEAMDGRRTSIVHSIQEKIPQQDFEMLTAAHSGSTLAKEVIHSAAEENIGRPWSGDVLISELLVY